MSSSSTPKRAKVFRACAGCKGSHTACDNERPCGRCVALGVSDACQDAECKKRGRPAQARRKDSRASFFPTAPAQSSSIPSMFGATHGYPSSMPAVLPFLPPIIMQAAPAPPTPHQVPTYYQPMHTTATTTNSSTLPGDTTTSSSASSLGGSPFSPDTENTILSTLSLLVSEIKELKGTIRDLQQETYELRSEQARMLQKLTSIAKSSTTTTSTTSSTPLSATSASASTSTSSAPSSSSRLPPERGATGPSTIHPLSKPINVAGITLQGIDAHSFVIRNPNKPIVFLLREQGYTGLVAAVNDAFCKLFQYDMDEVVGRPWQHLVAAGEYGRMLQLAIPFLKQFNNTFSPVLTIHPRCRTKDGTVFKAVTRHQFFYDNVGRPVWSAIALEGIIPTGEEMDGNHQHIHHIRLAMNLDSWSEDTSPHHNQHQHNFNNHNTSPSDPPSTTPASSTSSSTALTGGIPLGDCPGLTMNATGRYSWAWMPPPTPPAFFSSPQPTMFEEVEPITEP